MAKQERVQIRDGVVDFGIKHPLRAGMKAQRVTIATQLVRLKDFRNPAERLKISTRCGIVESLHRNDRKTAVRLATRAALERATSFDEDTEETIGVLQFEQARSPALAGQPRQLAALYEADARNILERIRTFHGRGTALSSDDLLRSFRRCCIGVMRSYKDAKYDIAANTDFLRVVLAHLTQKMQDKREAAWSTMLSLEVRGLIAARELASARLAVSEETKQFLSATGAIENQTVAFLREAYMGNLAVEQDEASHLLLATLADARDPAGLRMILRSLLDVFPKRTWRTWDDELRRYLRSLIVSPLLILTEQATRPTLDINIVYSSHFTSLRQAIENALNHALLTPLRQHARDDLPTVLLRSEKTPGIGIVYGILFSSRNEKKYRALRGKARSIFEDSTRQFDTVWGGLQSGLRAAVKMNFSGIAHDEARARTDFNALLELCTEQLIGISTSSASARTLPSVLKALTSLEARER